MMALPLCYPCCEFLLHYHLYALGKHITTSAAASCSERLGSLPGSGARSSTQCIIALNFNLYQVTLKRKENKQAKPLAASLDIVFLTKGSQSAITEARSAKTYI